MTPPRHDKTPPPKELTDSQRELVAIVEDRIDEAFSDAVAKITPLPSETTKMAEQAHEAAVERGKELVRWDRCKKEGPIFELRAELAKQNEEREKSMKKAVLVATFVVTAVTGGIQIWGKLSERQAANNELAQMVRELRAEVRTATMRAGEPQK